MESIKTELRLWRHRFEEGQAQIFRFQCAQQISEEYTSPFVLFPRSIDSSFTILGPATIFFSEKGPKRGKIT